MALVLGQFCSRLVILLRFFVFLLLLLRCVQNYTVVTGEDYRTYLMRVQRIAASVVRNQAKPLDLFFAFLWLSIRQGTNRCAVE